MNKRTSNKQQIMQEALATAKSSGIPIAVCRDAIANAEDPGDWGYCPEGAQGMLFPHAAKIIIIYPED